MAEQLEPDRDGSVEGIAEEHVLLLTGLKRLLDWWQWQKLWMLTCGGAGGWVEWEESDLTVFVF
jgi:hypothetical protein